MSHAPGKGDLLHLHKGIDPSQPAQCAQADLGHKFFFLQVNLLYVQGPFHPVNKVSFCKKKVVVVDSKVCDGLLGLMDYVEALGTFLQEHVSYISL